MLLHAACTIRPSPVTTRQASESQSERENENAMRPEPKRPAAAGITRLNPTTDLRPASQMAPISAPPPDAVMRNPSVWAPPPSTSPATIGISTEYGTPTRLTIASSAMIARMGGDPKA